MYVADQTSICCPLLIALGKIMVSFLFEPLLWSHHFAVGWCSRIFTSWWWRINICPQKIRLGKELCRRYTIALAAFIPAVKEEHLASGGSGWQHQWREWTFGRWQACRQSVRFCLLSTAPTYIGVGATFTQALVIYRESPFPWNTTIWPTMQPIYMLLAQLSCPSILDHRT